MNISYRIATMARGDVSISISSVFTVESDKSPADVTSHRASATERRYDAGRRLRLILDVATRGWSGRPRRERALAPGGASTCRPRISSSHRRKLRLDTGRPARSSAAAGHRVDTARPDGDRWPSGRVHATPAGRRAV